MRTETPVGANWSKPGASKIASSTPARRGLIITADDFGLHELVNLAVESAHRNGILTAASLMVTGPASADAIRRAKQMPSLRVGLHLVLADGIAQLPPALIPDLVDDRGRFGDHMARDGVRFFLLPQVRRQLAAEIRAQFEAFSASGLPLDHVNAHKHFHLHPTVLSLILRIGRDYGLRAVRLPWEPGAPLWLRPWLILMRVRLKRAGIACNDRVFGIRRSGAMDENEIAYALEHLADGVTEIYLHPALASGEIIAPSMPSYRHADELTALLSQRVRELLDSTGVDCGGFTDLLVGGE